VNRILRVEAI